MKAVNYLCPETKLQISVLFLHLSILFDAFKHFVETSIFTEFLFKVLFVSGETSYMFDVIHKWTTFKGIRGDGNRGCIPCENDERS